MALILDYLVQILPWLLDVFVVLGALVVVGTAVDAVIPDEKDGGFMAKALAIPILGSILKAVKKFSPFNVTPKE